MLKKFSEIFTRVLFGTFCILLLIYLFAVAQDPSSRLLVGCITLPFFLITLCSSYWGIWAFVATVPLVNGLLLLNGVGDISLAFAGIYLAWFPKQLVQGTRLKPSTASATFANLLAAIVLLNVLLFFARTIDNIFPSGSWMAWFRFFPFIGQDDNLWQLNAALILLQGIFLFRMIGIEVRGRTSWILFTRTVYVQALFIVGFSIVQFVGFTLHDVDYLGLNLPFNDIHSYGSYGVLLFGVFFCFFLVIGKVEFFPEGGSAGGRQVTDSLFRWSATKGANGVLSLLFLGICLLSSSRATWLAMGITLLLIIILEIKNRKTLCLLGIAIILILLAGGEIADRMLQSGGPAPSLQRLRSLMHVTKLKKDTAMNVRFELWDRAESMVKEYPLTGVGIGNFYRNSAHYKKRDLGKWDHENTHNYYLQLAAEIGIPGAVLFVALLFVLYFRPLIYPGHAKDPPLQPLPVKPFLCGTGAYLLTMGTGHPLLLSNQQFLFWSLLAIISKGQLLQSSLDEEGTNGYRICGMAGGGLLLLYLAGFCVNVYHKGPWTIPAQYGLYSIEYWEGMPMRWMAGKARYSLPAGTKVLDLEVVAQPFNSQGPEGLTLKIAVNDAVVGTVHFLNGGTKKLRYDVASFNRKDMRVDLEVDRVFCPRKIGLNSDIRTLGVAVRSNPWYSAKEPPGKVK